MKNLKIISIGCSKIGKMAYLQIYSSAVPIFYPSNTTKVENVPYRALKQIEREGKL